MPSIRQLQITSFRNISEAKLDFAPHLNLIAGDNGSGKSSLLEAVHYAGLGRSFRNTRQTPVIQHDKNSCAVYCLLDNAASLGLSKTNKGASEIRVNGEKASTSAELARLLPLQLLNAETFQLLEGGPKARRQFIDWGVFHVEHRFHDAWRNFKRCLQNRNTLLRKQAGTSEMAPWNHEFCRLAEVIDDFRHSYLEIYLPELAKTISRLVQQDGLEFRYSRGWKSELSILEAIERSWDRDRIVGHTTAGPHRADLKIKIDSQPAASILSRGQQKLVASAMKLAQGAHLANLSGNICVYLIDDLPAELDRKNRRKVCAVLHDLGGQVFITGTEKTELIDTLQTSGFDAMESKLFHVKHGRIEASETGPKPDQEKPEKPS